LTVAPANQSVCSTTEACSPSTASPTSFGCVGAISAAIPSIRPTSTPPRRTTSERAIP